MTKCVLCGKEFEGQGHNPEPLSLEGRCCDECNLGKVVPARLEEQAGPALDSATELAPIDKINSDEVFFSGLHIPENDRLKYYQLMKRYWELKMESFSEDDLIRQEQMQLLKQMWRLSFKASLEEAKVFSVDDDVVPMLLHTECEEEELPFPSLFIDAKAQLKDRTYYGFHVGSYYSEKASYRAILSVYSKVIKHKGQDVKTLIPDFILLKKTDQDDLLDSAFKEENFFHNKIRNLVFSFCLFINEPDVAIMDMKLNPKNNIRRKEKGNMALPEYKKITIHGKLRLHVDNLKTAGARSKARYRYWVRGFYRHFWDKKRYEKLYKLNEEERKKAGLTYSEKHAGILRIWVKPSQRGSGILIKQSWEVKE